MSFLSKNSFIFVSRSHFRFTCGSCIHSWSRGLGFMGVKRKAMGICRSIRPRTACLRSLLEIDLVAIG